jgi:hypothetical protein
LEKKIENGGIGSQLILNSAPQYAIISTSPLAGPSPRRLRWVFIAIIKLRHLNILKDSYGDSPEDDLQNPNHVIENMTRAKRFVDSISYKGPIVAAGDCTKLRSRLTYSNDFGSNILDSVLPLKSAKLVDEVEDIARIIGAIKKKNAMACK